MTTSRTITLPETARGRLDAALMRVAVGWSRRELKAAFREGRVRIEGRKVTSAHPARPGSSVTLVESGPAPDLRPALTIEVVHADDAIIVVEKPADVPIHILLPSYIISEVKTAFAIGFLLYIPFLVIDMVVASVLMSMGMFMLSPMTISLPFKLLLFVMINGWELVVEGLVKSFKQPVY